jgi:hypothetical protein
MSAVQHLPLATLVEDMSVYPRHAVDEVHVGTLVQALQAGATLPPLVADKASKKIVDGWHRARAYKRVLGADAVVDVELRAYASEDALLLDAIALNAAHGRKLDKIDQVRAVVLADQRGIATPLIATAMHIPQEKIEPLRVRVARAPSGSRGTVTGTQTVVLKRPLRHLEGHTLSEEQVKAAAGAPGTSYLLLAHQLRDGLRCGLVNLSDATLVAALRELQGALAGALAGS